MSGYASLLVAIAELSQPCTPKLCEAAIFDRSLYEVGCLQRWVFTQRSYLLPASLGAAVRSKKIAASHNEVVQAAQHNKVVQGCNQRLLPTEGRLAIKDRYQKVKTKLAPAPTK